MSLSLGHTANTLYQSSMEKCSNEYRTIEIIAMAHLAHSDDKRKSYINQKSKT